MRSLLAGRPLRAAVLGLAGLPGLAVVAVLLPAGVARADAATTVVGQLVRTWTEAAPAEEAAGSSSDVPLTWVEPPHGRAVRVPADDVAALPTGATVAVTLGGHVSDDAGDDGFPAARDVLAADVVEEPAQPELPARRLTNQVTVALVAPKGSTPDGVRLRDLVDAVDGPVADFWAEQSDGAISVGVTATAGWLTTDAGCSEPTALWDEAAAKAGFTPGPGKHLLLYVPRDADCSYGLAEVGTGLASGGRLYVHDVLPSLIAHELGHNFGLGHSSGRQCENAVDDGRCRTAGYRDFYDVMGVSWQEMGSLNAAQAARLGLLPADAQQRLTHRTAPAELTLSPLGGRTGLRAIRLAAAPGVDFWLEYRSPTGRDAWLGSTDNVYGLQSGVLLHRVGALPDTSLLLDGSPGRAAGWDDDLHEALPLDRPVTVGGFTILVHGQSPDAATLSVVPSSAPLAAAAPAPRSAPAVLPASASAVHPVHPVHPAATGVDTQPGSPAGATAPVAAAGPSVGQHLAVAERQAAEGAQPEAPRPTSTTLAAATSELPPVPVGLAALGLGLTGGLLAAAVRGRRTTSGRP